MSSAPGCRANRGQGSQPCRKILGSLKRAPRSRLPGLPSDGATVMFRCSPDIRVLLTDFPHPAFEVPHVASRSSILLESCCCSMHHGASRNSTTTRDQCRGLCPGGAVDDQQRGRAARGERTGDALLVGRQPFLVSGTGRRVHAGRPGQKDTCASVRSRQGCGGAGHGAQASDRRPTPSLRDDCIQQGLSGDHGGRQRQGMELRRQRVQVHSARRGIDSGGQPRRGSWRARWPGRSRRRGWTRRRRRSDVVRRQAAHDVARRHQGNLHS